MKLVGKVAIVTGGGRGIGEAFAVRFAHEGAKVVVAGHTLERVEKVARQIEADGGQALALYSDVSDEASALNMVKATVERFGGLDILVNNAALFGALRRVPWNAWTTEEWDQVFSINILGM